MATPPSQDDGNPAPQSSPSPSPSHGFTSSKSASDVPAVRFSTIEEVSPEATAPAPADAPANSESNRRKTLAMTLQGRPLQERRLNTYHFEAFSLPPSRVPSREEDSHELTRHPIPNASSWHSLHGSPRFSPLTSPPLTLPAASNLSESGEKQLRSQRAEDRCSASQEPQAITPQPSASLDKPPSTTEHRPHATHRPASSDQVIKRSSSADDHKAHRRGMFSVGTGSTPASRESSPSRSAASHFYSKPMTLDGDANDPYSKGRRPPQQQHPSRRSIDPRFVFSRKKKHGSPGGSKSSLPEKRISGLFSFRGSNEEAGSEGTPQVSMVDLKHFFRKTGHSSQKKRDSSPASPRAGVKTPPASRVSTQLPFSEDHGLSSKYGKIGKVLGSGAGGSVRLMRRKDDGTVFAVKEFRARHAYETEKEYVKKVTAEFCVGSTLHHGNIIETLDILQEKGRWFEVMEYAPYDMFAIVMTGKMSREEIRCCFLQILNGVTYLHSLGLAHRDLKLDNVVISDRGIIKIIDFGSAHVFKYPFENGTVPAKGIVGSDPYLAPEVHNIKEYRIKEYDAAAADIWSLAIIFCCMTLRRFPWKIPRITDNSFKLFVAEPTPGHNPDHLLLTPRRASQSGIGSTHDPRGAGQGQDKEQQSRHSHSHRKQEGPEATSAPGQSQPQQATGTAGEQKEVIRGPWRILRLLPRESRHIIHRMLDINAKTRAAMEEILKERWVADTIICQQLENGEVVAAEDHVHVLEPPAPQQTAKA